MKLRSPFLLSLIANLFGAIAWCWLQTLRFQRHSVDGRYHPSNPQREQYLYIFWHEGIFGPLCDPGKLKTIVSAHADGEFIASLCKWLGLGAIRGSSTRGGRQAVLQMLKETGQDVNLVITPDGPKGPRRKLQAGPIWIASATGVPLILMGIGFARAWRANSWDKLAIPVPFSGACAYLSQPIHVPPDLDREAIELWQQHLEVELNRITDLAATWAESIRRQGPQAPPPQSGFVLLPAGFSSPAPSKAA